MNLGLGNNFVENASGILVVGGARIFDVGMGDRPLVELLNVWDASGVHVAKLRRGAWVHVAEGYV